jgi:hypothetical protein
MPSAVLPVAEYEAAIPSVGNRTGLKESQNTAKNPQIIIERNRPITHSNTVVRRRRIGPVKMKTPLLGHQITKIRKGHHAEAVQPGCTYFRTWYEY